MIKTKKHYKIAFLAKTREVLISEILNDSYISHGEFILINNVLKEYEKSKTFIPLLNILILLNNVIVLFEA